MVGFLSGDVGIVDVDIVLPKDKYWYCWYAGFKEGFVGSVVKLLEIR